MNSSPDHANEAGAAIGAVLAFSQEIFSGFTKGGLLHISWINVFDASMLAAVGATVGFITTAGLKRLKPHLKKLESKLFKPKS